MPATMHARCAQETLRECSVSFANLLPLITEFLGCRAARPLGCEQRLSTIANLLINSASWDAEQHSTADMYVPVGMGAFQQVM
jgi:hypothetical protein